MTPLALNVLLVLVPVVSLAATVGLYWRYRSESWRRLLCLLPMACCLAFVLVLARVGEGILNSVAGPASVELSERALALHRRSALVDLHADTLLFGRDLLERSSVGHVDLPRLLEGGTALQVFSVITRIPLGYNEEATRADRPDIISLLGIAHGWPLRTWSSPYERVRYQAHRLEEMATRSRGKLRLVRSREDLEGLLAARRRGEAVVGALLSIEGCHIFDPDFRLQLDVLFDEGLRMASLTHYFDNPFAGSVQGMRKGGLTRAGRALVAEFEQRGIVVDLAHASHRTIDDVLAIAREPVVFSHTGVAGTCDQYHNLGDRQIRAIAANGGVIGIGLWDTAVCGTHVEDTVRAIQYVVELVGDRYVALGSDFDGYVRTHFDAAGLPALTQAMLDVGLAPDSIERILGGNAVRVLRATLP